MKLIVRKGITSSAAPDTFPRCSRADAVVEFDLNDDGVVDEIDLYLFGEGYGRAE
jgi:hypothetical protein